MCLGIKFVKLCWFCLSNKEADNNCPPYVPKFSTSLPNQFFASDEVIGANM